MADIEKRLDPFYGFGVAFEPRPIARALVDMRIKYFVDHELDWFCDVDEICDPEAFFDEMAKHAGMQSRIVDSLLDIFKWAVQYEHCRVAESPVEIWTDAFELSTSQAVEWVNDLIRADMRQAFDPRDEWEHGFECLPGTMSLCPDVDLDVMDDFYLTALKGLCVIPNPFGTGGGFLRPQSIAIAAADWAIYCSGYYVPMPFGILMACLTDSVNRAVHNIGTCQDWLIRRGHLVAAAPTLHTDGNLPPAQNLALTREHMAALALVTAECHDRRDKAEFALHPDKFKQSRCCCKADKEEKE